MARTVSQGRQPLHLAGRRVPGVFVYEKSDGSRVFWLRIRVNNRPEWRRLEGVRNATEAAEAAAVMRGHRAEGELVRASTVTVSALIGSFLEHQRTRLSVGTHELYAQRLTSYFEPTFGRRRVSDLTTADLRTWLDAMRSGKIRSERGPLASSTQRGCLVAVQALLRFGRKTNVISRSPAADLDRDDRPSPARRREMRRLNPEQIDALLEKCGEQFKPVITLLAFSGLRVREALGLRWSDVDLEANRIAVAGQLGRDNVWTPVTKTPSSRASVPLLPAAKRELLAWKKKQGERNLAYVRPSALAFSTLRGRPQSARNVLRALDNAATAAGLNPEGKARLCTHDLRGSFVSNADRAGFSLSEVSKLARHASPNVTSRIYMDVLEGDEEQMGERLAASGYGS